MLKPSALDRRAIMPFGSTKHRMRPDQQPKHDSQTRQSAHGGAGVDGRDKPGHDG